MNGFVIWGLVGATLTAYVFWLVLWKDVMSDNPKSGQIPDEIKLPDLLTFIGLFIVGSAIWPFTAIFAIGFTWEWINASDIVVWRRKPKDDVKQLEKKAKKLGFQLAPKELNLEGIEEPENQKS